MRFAGAHSIFGRAEWAQKNELFLAAERRHGVVYDVGKISAGYVLDFLVRRGARVGAGVYGSVAPIDSELDFVYGKTPRCFGMFFRFATD